MKKIFRYFLFVLFFVSVLFINVNGVNAVPSTSTETDDGGSSNNGACTYGIICQYQFCGDSSITDCDFNYQTAIVQIAYRCSGSDKTAKSCTTFTAQTGGCKNNGTTSMNISFNVNGIGDRAPIDFTDEVYGDLPLDRKDLFFTETTPLHTSSPYSASKAGADLLVLAYHRTFGLPVTISRCSNNYGPYHFPEKLIPLMIQKALKNEPLPVYGNGQNVRDWLYVGDHCNAIDLIVRKGRDGEVYNVGGHNEKTNLEVVKTILKALNKPETLITYVKDRPGHDLRYAMDPTKIETELGWKPEYTFDTGIQETIKWNLENQEWINHVESGEYLNWMERYYESRF